MQRLPSLKTLTSASLGAALIGAAPAAGQVMGRTFTYQGELATTGGDLVTGQAAMRFRLFDAPEDGAPLATIPDVFLGGPPVVVDVQQGRFTVELDFFGGSGQPGALVPPGDLFNGEPLWLEIWVNNSPMAPRQELTPAPYAVAARGLYGNGSKVFLGDGFNNVQVGDGDAETGLQIPFGGVCLDADGQCTPPVGGLRVGVGGIIGGNSAGSDVLIVPEQTGFVGIGTPDPESDLHVNGSEILLTDGGGDPNKSAFMRIGVDADLVLTNQFSDDFDVATVRLRAGQEAELAAPGNHLFLSAGGSGPQDARHVVLQAFNGGRVGVGTATPQAEFDVEGDIRGNVIIIDGGADLAESYDVFADTGVEPAPGMVVAIDPDRVGKLRVAARAYDRTVAGVISGADGVRPGLVLGQAGTVADGDTPVANVGRVWCLVDADAGGPVAPGDLLTTSATPGHAMRVNDHGRANGAVLGKAMSRLESGRGLVLVLVSLQ